ncbi:MAG: TlpA disulfide reductase family protein [Gemmatimonadota bacterium]
MLRTNRRAALRVAGLATVAGAVLALGACSGDANEFRRVAVGDVAPPYAAPTLAGDTVALADLRGQVVLLNVWATWCAPCRREMPGLQALEETYREEGFHVLGVSIDARGAERAIRAFADDLGVSFTLLHDPDERVTRTYRTIGVPESFLIGREGVVVARWIGTFDPTDQATHAAVREALDAPVRAAL